MSTSMTFTTRERTLAEVFPHEIGTIRAKLDKINRRLAKLGAPAATLTVAPVEERTEVDDLGFRRTFLVHPTVTVVGVEARHAGWVTIASLDWTVSEGEAWVSKFPGHEDDAVSEAFRTGGPVCDHCGLSRSRNLTVVLVHEDGRTIRVGTGCVLEFLGVDPATALWLAGNGAGSDELREEGARPVFVDTVVDFLAVADALTEAHGFVPTKCDWGQISTRDEAQAFLGGRWTREEREAFEALAEVVDPARGEAIAAWVLATMTDGSDFAHNARQAVEAGVVHPRTAGILACLPRSFRKATEAAAAKAADAELPASAPIGAVGDKLTLAVVLTTSLSVETQFGTSRRVTGRVVEGPHAGAIVTTFGSGATLFGTAPGDQVTWTGAVKAHTPADDRWTPNATECKRVRLTAA